MTTAGSRRPLEGLRVLDFGQVLSMPYCAGLLTDLGTEDIKIEAPHRAASRAGQFKTVNRGKICIGLDMAQEEGKEIFRKLVAVSDIIIDNFTPRVMPGWGLGFDELKKINPRIIMLSNCGYGSTGPWGQLPIQGTSLESTMGLVNYTGYEDAASRLAMSYPDFLACWTGMLAIFTALEHLAKTGEGQWIDQSMYQIGVSFIPEPLLQRQVDGSDMPRIGNRHPWKAPSNVYHAAGDDRWLTISVDSDEKWQKLLAIMSRTDLANDARFSTIAARRQHVDEVDAIVDQWTQTQEPFAAMEVLQNAGINAGAVANARDIHFNEQYLHRKFLDPVDFGGDMGVRPVTGLPYNILNTPLYVTKPGPEFGDANGYVLRDILHLGEDEIARLYELNVICDEPTVPPAENPGLLRAGVDPMDDDYLQKLHQHWGAARETSST